MNDQVKFLEGVLATVTAQRNEANDVIARLSAHAQMLDAKVKELEGARSVDGVPVTNA